MILQILIKPIVAGVINISTLGRVGILHISLSWQNGKILVLSKHFLQIEVLHLSILVQLLLSTYSVDILWGQQIKLYQVVSTSEFHEY